jgi:hypothetical protein
MVHLHVSQCSLFNSQCSMIIGFGLERDPQSGLKKLCISLAAADG